MHETKKGCQGSIEGMLSDKKLSKRNIGHLRAILAALSRGKART